MILTPGDLTANDAKLIDLGVIAYERAHDLQRRLVAQRESNEVGDCLVLLEHPHVFTRGRKARDARDLLNPGNIRVIEVERGGEITYHGPGQLVAYPIFKLDEEERDAPAFIRRLEQWVIAALADLGVTGGEHQRGFSGVWVGERKIASVGVAVTAQWVTWHGIAVNISTELDYFTRINPCGLQATVMTSASALLGQKITIDAAKAALIEQAPAHLGRRVVVGS